MFFLGHSVDNDCRLVPSVDRTASTMANSKLQLLYYVRVDRKCAIAFRQCKTFKTKFKHGVMP